MFSSMFFITKSVSTLFAPVYHSPAALPLRPACLSPQVMAYNERVPTPFYHLAIAHQLSQHPALSERIRNALNQHQSAFLLGNTAPDVQVVSGQTREATHFYTLPPQDQNPAWQNMLAAYPALGAASALPAEQAIFIAGYCCHLQADEAWLYEIFIPLFGPQAEWEDFRKRLYIHNVLRIYLDRQVLEALPEDTAAQLSRAEPQKWLPFVGDEHLREWRDYLANQLAPGAPVHTVEVFAQRQGLPSEQFQDLLASESRMQAEVFAHLPEQRLDRFQRKLVEENVALLLDYLKGI